MDLKKNNQKMQNFDNINEYLSVIKEQNEDLINKIKQVEIENH